MLGRWENAHSSHLPVPYLLLLNHLYTVWSSWLGVSLLFVHYNTLERNHYANISLSCECSARTPYNTHATKLWCWATWNIRMIWQSSLNLRLHLPFVWHSYMFFRHCCDLLSHIRFWKFLKWCDEIVTYCDALQVNWDRLWFALVSSQFVASIHSQWDIALAVHNKVHKCNTNSDPFANLLWFQEKSLQIHIITGYALIRKQQVNGSSKCKSDLVQYYLCLICGHHFDDPLTVRFSLYTDQCIPRDNISQFFFTNYISKLSSEILNCNQIVTVQQLLEENVIHVNSHALICIILPSKTSIFIFV